MDGVWTQSADGSSIAVTGLTPKPMSDKLNPLWWLVGDNGWDVPDTNNGVPYLPNVTNKFLRRLIWFGKQNIMMNFAGFVLGVEDQNRYMIGTPPLMATTYRDLLDNGITKFGWKFMLTELPMSKTASIITVLGVAVMMGFGVFWTWPLFFVLSVTVFRAIGILPFASYWGGNFEFYLGWRPSGGLGMKVVWH